MTSLILAFVLAQEPPARSGVGAARIGGTAYVVGGALEREGSFVRSLLAYEFGSGKWSEKARLPEPIAFPAVAALGGRLYVFGGLHADNTHCGHAWFYDPATDRWHDLAPLPTARSRATCTVLQGKLAVIGGISPEAAVGINSDKVEVYDPAARTWSRLAPMPTARHGHVSEFVKDRLVVAGGYGERQLDSVEMWDPGAGWTKVASLPETRGFALSVAFDGEMWVFGSRGAAAHPLRFDPAAGKWTATTAEDTARHRGAAVEYQGKAWLFFGEEAGGAAVRVFDLRRAAWAER
jgi:N-acetylneuraminic acid mutarotase